MDSILVIGCGDGTLLRFLEKVGYKLISPTLEPVANFLAREVVDLVLIDGRGEADALAFCELLREQEATKSVPIVLLAADTAAYQEAVRRSYQRFQALCPPFSVGSAVSKIATELRLRKMAGEDEGRASLGEINARLRDLNSRFKKELEEARAIQQSLIPPHLPEDERFDIAVSYEPLEEVGGDWYYVESRKDGKVGIQAGDVTGHGLAAAFIGVMTKLAMTAAGEVPPDQLLTTMNKLMTPNLPEGRFVTLFSCLYDPAAGDVAYARAGHPPALILKREDGSAHWLKSDGFAFGFFEDGVYGAGHAHLEIEDVLVVFTDALPESQNRSGKTYDYEPMAQAVRSTPASSSASEILMAILDDFDRFREGRMLKDDVTLIVLKRTS